MFIFKQNSFYVNLQANLRSINTNKTKSKIVSNNNHTNTELKPPSWSIFYIIIGFLVFGLLMIFDTSLIYTTEVNLSPFHFVIRQTIFAIIGIGAALFIAKLNLNKFAKYSWLPLAITLIGMIITILIGNQVNGSNRWIVIGDLFNIQFGEFLKPAIIFYLSFWIAKVNAETSKSSIFNLKSSFTYIAILVFTLAVSSLLLLIQKDLGTVFVIGISSIILFISSIKSNMSRFLSIFVIVLLVVIGAIGIFTSDYRQGRVEVYKQLFMNGRLDSLDLIQNEGRQMYQTLIAVSSGGILGKGFGNSIQKHNYIDSEISYTDALFPIFAEEFGLVGCLILIFAYVYFIWKILTIADIVPNEPMKNLLKGLICYIGVQAFFHIGVNLSLFPFKGLTLPFLSYGGSSLVSLLVAIGLILSASRWREY